jgi:alpha-D-ribose 1-methylphosphonate 5-triphosphate synthase subunit PhnH
MSIQDETLMTQKTFSALLQAMSHPGRVYRLEDKIEAGSRISDPYNLFSVLLTLLDHEVGFCVIGPEKEYLEPAVSELTRCPVKNPEETDFMIVSSGESHGEILKAKRGTLEYPDTGATVIYRVASLENKGDKKIMARLKGPGIKKAIDPVIQGLGRNELSYIKEINSEYPLGIDCIFADSANRIMCIPRSTRIEVI